MPTTTKKTTKAKPPVSLKKKIKPEEYFILCSGAPIKNVMELVDSFETMNDGVFYHHVNDQRNDFANWLVDVFNAKELAKDIESVRDKHTMERRMLKYLVRKYM